MLKNKVSGKSYLMGVGHLIWDKIIEQISRTWRSFIIMKEEASLVRKVEKYVEDDLQELGNKPQLANQIIKVLNSKTKE